MDIPEVGSKWVAKVDNPRQAGISKGDVVEVTCNEFMVDYIEGHDTWCCLEDHWHENFDPYVERTLEFKVGDKVKCLHPVVVNQEFEGRLGKVVEILDGTVKILYSCGTEQDAWPP